MMIFPMAKVEHSLCLTVMLSAKKVGQKNGVKMYLDTEAV